MYFSGFSLKNEKELFDQYLIDTDFCVSGFSYGAIKAFEYVLNTNDRIDTLQLISPAFFQNKDQKYKRMQMMFFKKDPDQYTNKFLENCGFDTNLSEKYFQLGSDTQLKELLYFNWDEIKLKNLVDRGITIEVYLGGDDKIIESKIACEFFRQFGEVYFIKGATHILR